MVKVSPAPEPIYPEGKGVEDQTLYVRLGNTTTTLSARQATLVQLRGTVPVAARKGSY